MMKMKQVFILILLFNLRAIPILSQVLEDRSDAEIEEVLFEDNRRMEEMNRNIERIKNEAERSLDGLEGRVRAALEKQTVERAKNPRRNESNKRKSELLKRLSDQNRRKEAELARTRRNQEALEKANRIRAEIEAIKDARAEATYRNKMREYWENKPAQDARFVELKEIRDSSGRLHLDLGVSIRPVNVESTVPANFGNNKFSVGNNTETISLAQMFSSLEQKDDTKVTPNDDDEYVDKILEKELEISSLLDTMENKTNDKKEDNKAAKSQEQDEKNKKDELEKLLNKKLDNY